MLISCAVTAQLFCIFVFAYADCWFSHAKAQILYGPLQRNTNATDSNKMTSDSMISFLTAQDYQSEKLKTSTEVLISLEVAKMIGHIMRKPQYTSFDLENHEIQGTENNLAHPQSDLGLSHMCPLGLEPISDTAFTVI